jgi:hypothetical protein
MSVGTSYDPVAFAQQEVDAFEAVLREHHEALNCRDCEEFLQKGISAYAWLERAEDTVLQAENDCLREYDQSVHDAIDALHRQWMGPRQRAERWIAELASKHFEPENLAEFRECQQKAEQWIATADAIASATLSHAALSDYARQTGK